ncbi:hypothetical protein ANCCAN_30397 [Ancylostoma caninum]|uniref:Uncharacterized protein n=1 Tax=Ancylostoma caninum TaxID=29170 RepID=A0A368EW53_ANCCA|nr:hypothetical protein ANCCAN_30397 [Ancylostoma caninum]
MMLQMQESYRLNQDATYVRAVTTAQKERDVEGFDVNEMYGTKNELLLMALNYDMTSRQSPEGFQSHS